MTETVGGRYELDGPLGRGGMAEVRRAVDLRLGRSVAVKQLRPDLATDPTFQARFRREAQSAAGLNHPTIVAVYDTGEEPDPRTGVSIPYIVMELVEGPTLRDVLRDGRKILPERALELTAGVLDALGYSHRAGIIHRDIKPANVMLTTNGTVKVMDFGIARAVADTSATMTQTAAVIGTAQYLSPEQARGETVDARSDLYSTGCLLYELLTGRPPFTGDSPVSVAYQHVREAPVPPSQIDPEIGPDIDAIVLKSLAKDPADRYQSAREMKADINRVLAGQQATAVVPRVPVAVPVADAPTRVVTPAPTAVAVTTTTTDEPDEEEPKRRTGMVVLLSLLVLALVAGAVFAVYRLTNPSVQDVAVPDVLTYTESQARGLVEGAGLRFSVEHTNGDESTKGTVVAQDPAGKTQAPSGSTVTVTVNDGPESADIPTGLVGEDVDDAKKKLEKAGFSDVDTNAATSEDPSDKEGEVLSVSPDEGTSAPLSTKVTVTYATGKSAVPDVRGSSRAGAERTLKEAGFTKVSVSSQVSSQPEGTVVSQSPDGGSEASRSTTIKLVVAAPAPTAPPPSTPTESPTAPSTPSSTPSESGNGNGNGEGNGNGNGEGNGSGNGGGDGNGNGNGGGNGNGNGNGGASGNGGAGNGGAVIGDGSTGNARSAAGGHLPLVGGLGGTDAVG
ncbi:serine/threonine protein kinase [Microlunatus flavus]|uniref:non-specific serine/threonine protein kinase n=1 Tax=Microlunatus flavus TaxID=1036181 RepID=A0A1H9B613_9ACTN|nr:Stk1 family PASTA domain-containing Ser/Thr kinase [Microlunatus flavus]SEP84123.1 serine/threonine protein kinase [Microlunatus flavus]